MGTGVNKIQERFNSTSHEVSNPETIALAMNPFIIFTWQKNLLVVLTTS